MTKEKSPDYIASKPRRAYQSERQVQRRIKILQVAKKMLSEYGYHGVNMDKLAGEAGVTKMTLYNIFGGKDKLLASVVSDSFIAITRNFVDKAQPGLAAILARHDGIVATTKKDPLYADTMTMAFFNASSGSDIVNTLVKDAYDFYLKQIVIAAETGQLSTLKKSQFPSIANLFLSIEWGMTLLMIKQQLDINSYETQSRAAIMSQLYMIASDALKPQFSNPAIY